MAPDTVCTLLLSLMAVTVHAYPNGAQNNASNPMSAFSSHCSSGNFRPNHKPFMSQPPPYNYTISINSPSGNIYRPGQIITVTIEGIDTNSAKPFKGFFIHGDSTEASFAGDLVCDQGKKTHVCSISGVTHVNPQLKPKVICRWTPPDFQIGTVRFQATVVQSYDTFWTGIMSPMTLQPAPTTMTYEEKAQQMREEMMRQFRSGSDMFKFLGQQPQQGQLGAVRGATGQTQSNSFGVRPGRQNSGQEMANLPSQFGQFFQTQAQKYRPRN